MVFLWAVMPNASAEVVTGRIIHGSPSTAKGMGSGYVRTLVTAPSTALVPPKAPMALFLRVKESLPLDAVPPLSITFSGLELVPPLAACAVDGGVELKNADLEPVTFVVGEQPVGVVEPGASLVYECTAGTAGEETRRVSVLEWPWVRGGIYVGEVGAPGVVEEDGRFRIEASRGTYVLRVIGPNETIFERPLEVVDRTLNLGVIDLTESAEP